MGTLDTPAILSERLRRQGLTAPLTKRADYVDLFRRLQPVSPIHFSCPGEPPRLAHRTRFDDEEVSNELRSTRAIVKGRFLGGNIGYVLAEDLALYANTFRKPLNRVIEVQEEVWEAVRAAGPLTPRQVKEETGLLNKHIMPALHRLQRAFLVYEDQVDGDWERPWYDFETEWPEVDVNENSFQENAVGVLERFFDAHVFATFERVRDWSQLPVRTLKSVLEDMEASGLLVSCEAPGLGDGWRHERPVRATGKGLRPSVFMLDKADFLVRSHASELKRQFGGREVLQYLLIDGAFQGAVLGHWRIGPHDVDDIVLTLPKAERDARREEILASVACKYTAPRHRILAYNGKRL